MGPSCRRCSVLLFSWSLVKFNMHSYWLTYGHMAMAKYKCHPGGNNCINP